MDEGNYAIFFCKNWPWIDLILPYKLSEHGTSLDIPLKLDWIKNSQRGC